MTVRSRQTAELVLEYGWFQIKAWNIRQRDLWQENGIEKTGFLDPVLNIHGGECRWVDVQAVGDGQW